MKNAALFVVGLAVCNLSFSAEPTPSMEMVTAWWNSKSAEKITIYDRGLVPIFLKDHEAAFLLDVGFFGRGTNFQDQTVLIRPRLREVREAGDPVRRDSVAHDLDHDGISEVETVSLGSGQGTTAGTRSIVQFDGWTPVVLHQAQFEDNEGFWGTRDNRYHSRSVAWKFADVDGDGIGDLIETITTKKGRKNRDPIVTRGRYTYVFKHGQFVPLADYRKAQPARKEGR